MKILLFAASLRKTSYNRKFIKQAADVLKNISGIELDHADFLDFEMPIFNEDVEETQGIPKGAQNFINRIVTSDALIISTPEYNGSIPGTLKNAIDWASRNETNPFEDKPLLLLGASPGVLGAIRGLWHTRVPFEALDTFVYPEMFGLPRAHQAFDESGNFIDPKMRARLETLLNSYLEFVKKLKQNILN